MGHRKKRMQDMVTQVNNNSNGKGNILSPAIQPWDTVSAPRKKSEAKKEGEHGPTYIRNPDKIVNKETGLKKEEYIRSGDRRKKRKQKVAELGVFASGAMTMFGKDIKRVIKNR
tara:strand:+ start:705 stop:1046 length:342 start_codon:yes stop_codon:yes gene_type:complete